MLGRAPLDEDAIRTIEDQHPGIEFDWPAILALSEVMTPEEEAPAPKPKAPSQSAAPGGKKNRRPRRDDRSYDPVATGENADSTADGASAFTPRQSEPAEPQEPLQPQPLEPLELLEPLEPGRPKNLLLEELAGREIGARLRQRHAEIVARIENLDVDGAAKDALFRRAEAIDPELWLTPESVLEGVRNADALFEKLKADVGLHSSRE
ncbi:MAG TPA: hypothetical protein VF239_09025 [Vicinamibacterales bacterium]